MAKEPSRIRTTVSSNISPTVRRAFERAGEQMENSSPVMVERPLDQSQLTEEEMAAEERANARAGWSFSRESATRQLERFLNGDAREKAKVSYRFDDANFHRLSRALDSGNLTAVKEIWDEIFEDWTPSARERRLFGRYGFTFRR